jgi:hypothetical protein
MKTKEELQERAQLVRIHEANCSIPFPTALEANFRIAVMKRLAAELGLRELRVATLDGPGTGITARPGGRNGLSPRPAAP